MQPRGIDAYLPRPETTGEIKITPDTIAKLNAELLRLTTETEALWSSFQDCRRDGIPINKASGALALSCRELIFFIEGLRDEDLFCHVPSAALDRAMEEYWIACKLLGIVIR